MKRTGKIISVFCALLMVMSLMAGCANDSSKAIQKKSKSVNESSGSEADKIGEDAALEIALKDAGLSESKVKRIRCELDYDDDDGRYEYEVEFRKGTTEYDYTIDAFSGEILEKDVDKDDD